MAERDRDAAWGRLIACGVTMRQTDRPMKLLVYLQSRAPRRRKPAASEAEIPFLAALGESGDDRLSASTGLTTAACRTLASGAAPLGL